MGCVKGMTSVKSATTSISKKMQNMRTVKRCKIKKSVKTAKYEVFATSLISLLTSSSRSGEASCWISSPSFVLPRISSASLLSFVFCHQHYFNFVFCHQHHFTFVSFHLSFIFCLLSWSIPKCPTFWRVGHSFDGISVVVLSMQQLNNTFWRVRRKVKCEFCNRSNALNVSRDILKQILNIKLNVRQDIIIIRAHWHIENKTGNWSWMIGCNKQ